MSQAKHKQQRMARTELSVEKAAKKEDWNTRITRFFLENTRITIMALIAFLLVGIIAFTNLRTTGFPNPELKFALIRTVYPQASAQTVLEQVTTPLENAVKGVEGVEQFTSTSSDNFSLISITIAVNAQTNDVINKLNTAVSAVSLPTGVEKPVVQQPNIGGPDFVYTLFGDTIGQAYDAQETFEREVGAIESTNEIAFQNKIERVIEVSYTTDQLGRAGLNEQALETAIKNANQTIPVALNQLIDGQQVNILAGVSARSVEDIQNIRILQQTNLQLPPREVRLGDVVTISETFRQGDESLSGQRLTSGSLVTQAVTVNLKVKADTDQTRYSQDLEEKFKSLPATQVVKETEVANKTQPVLLIENYSTNTQNQEQVAEIVQGLIGGAFKVDNWFLANVGWIFGALQLVFLVMLVFVSWRAAIIASVSIPLSILVSMIYLYITGNSLNTLVLFSLVLVIGLVVDPALVVLEAIQRKIDAGLKGTRAALEAVKDIGPGLFAATLTNGIVFIPLAVVSGTLGQIFAYIPATILPALVGSYFVPLIFLTFLGAVLLRRAKNKTEDEQKNLWPFAKWLIALNTRILNSNAWLRLGIIVLVTGLSVGITALLIGGGNIKFTQFASASDSAYLQLSVTTPNNLSETQKNTALADAFKTVLNNQHTISIYPLQGEYLINLTPKSERPNKKANAIAKDLNTELEKLRPRIDAKTAVLSNGPPAGDYQVQLSIKTNDFANGSATARTLTEIVTNACINNKRQFLFENCGNNTKVVDKVLDGYADFSKTSYKVVFDTQKLQQNGLAVESVPPAILAGSQLRSGFPTETTEPVTTLTKVDGSTIEVFLNNTNTPLSTRSSLENFQLQSPRGTQISLKDVAVIEETVAQTSIGRVDGETLTRYQIGLKEGYTDQSNAAQFENALLKYLQEGGKSKIEANGLKTDAITTFESGGTAEFAKSFRELGLALILAIIAVYFVLAIFMRSFTIPLVVLYTIPVTFIGIFPALALFTNGEFGFLEIIGLIILVGLVINAAIFLVDSARQQQEQGVDDKTAIARASGIRLRPVLLTKFTAVASLSPLIVTSEFYRNLAMVIVSGIVVSGFLSLITTPILYIAFRRFSQKVRGLFQRSDRA